MYESSVLLTEEMAIRQVFDRMAAAWNAGDATAFAQCLTGDCDYVTFAGQHINGRQANEQTHRQLFDLWVMKESVLHPGPAPTTITFLSDTIALVHSTGVIQLRFQKKPPRNRLSIQTNVMLRIDGEWKVRAFHNCRIQRPNWVQRIVMSFKSK